MKAPMRGRRLFDNLRLAVAFIGEATRMSIGEKRYGIFQPCEFDLFCPSVGTFHIRRFTDDFNYVFSYYYGFVEREAQRFVRENLREGDVFIDVGAHIGFYTVMAGRLVGRSGLVVALEPNPFTYRALLANIAINGLNNVVALNLAASNERCSATMWARMRSFTGSSSLHEDWSRSPDVETVQVSVSTILLDDLIELYKLNDRDGGVVVKIDVEGHELSALEGGKTLLKLADFLVCETIRERIERCLKIIEPNGLRVEMIEPLRFRPSIFNLLAVRKDG